MTQHTEEACDRYIKAFKKVRMLHGKMKPLEIAQIIGMSEWLVNGGCRKSIYNIVLGSACYPKTS
jgi:hypothetical protein